MENTSVLREHSPSDLGYRFAHLGIDPRFGEPQETVALLKAAFGLSDFDVGNSVMVSGSIEVMKAPGRGRCGHIGIWTKDLERAVEDLREKRFFVDEDSAVWQDGKRVSVYLQQEIGGYAIHLLQARNDNSGGRR